MRATAGAPAPRNTRRWLSAWRWKPRLARHRTGANRRREAGRWCVFVPQSLSRPRPARHGPRAASSSAASPSSDSEPRRTCAAQETRRWLGVGGRSWHVTPRTRTIQESLLPAECAVIDYRPSTTSATWRARAASSSAAPHSSDSERRRTSSAQETRRCLGVDGRSLHVAPRARNERERLLVGAGGL